MGARRRDAFSNESVSSQRATFHSRRLDRLDDDCLDRSTSSWTSAEQRICAAVADTHGPAFDAGDVRGVEDAHYVAGQAHLEQADSVSLSQQREEHGRRCAMGEADYDGDSQLVRRRQVHDFDDEIASLAAN
ncbi:hypothetical protein JCM10296v2_006521 [Rhodotorula toruloides]